ncbi:hypothetical protein QAD02_024179 [Eretmocerus hayati]|uniref:Uncharacterized protein n=1 Tax=Eretmocerus hayati TaxID=131215 RepID=A0ACC2Q0I8_9HYME|nr:hypothetical protein QAD02_024179 [Eretmocerus hayati]
MSTSRQLSDVDELFDVKNNFYIGNYQQCINEAQRLKPSTKEVEIERDVVVAATIYYHEDNVESALRVLYQADHLECYALTVQIYLKMDRVDLAQKEVKVMQEKDDDATLTQLALAWVNLSAGQEKFQEAFYIYQELIEKYSSTIMLLNGKANCLILQGKYEEAEPVLQEALDKDSDNPDILINMMVLSKHLGKPEEVINRYLTQLKESHKDHPFVKDLAEKELEFDRLAAQYAAQLKTES